mgnify:CR=1 FL=1
MNRFFWILMFSMKTSLRLTANQLGTKADREYYVDCMVKDEQAGMSYEQFRTKYELLYWTLKQNKIDKTAKK